MPSPDPDQPDDRHADDDAAWAEIVANYGPQPVLAEEIAPEVEVAHVFDDDVDEEPDWGDDDDLVLPGDFVPPEPEALGWHGWRSVAWIGVLGSPALALIWTFLSQWRGWSAPTFLAYLLIGAFLGGFAYLVLTMPKDRDDPWDDGARV
ncbi:hypothetical protein [Nocardioides sp.]|uniref:hypothetical protein n=1 Tax=Nocardioides sp. TaxID=35761 RepID=UPI002619889C|nr:hypothetical protein [Nocardioides sp.]